jgi:hypothetical protein
MQAPLQGWRSEQRLAGDGAVESEQRAVALRPVVAGTPAGAARLGEVYWDEVRRFTRGLVRAFASDGGMELRLLGRRGPALLRFGPPLHAAHDHLIRCAYPIRGGRLVRRPGGEIAFGQAAGPEIELTSSISGFFPALAAPPGRPRWFGLLYSHGQRRLHKAVSRRYFVRLLPGSLARST